MLRLFILGLVFLPAAEGLEAQSAQERALAPPSHRLLCTTAPADSVDVAHQATRAFHFIDGEEPFQRDINVSYDSLGTPVHLALLSVSASSSGEVEGYAILVRFERDGSWSGMRLYGGDESGNSSAQRSPTADATPLSQREAEQARTLAGTLWERRCGGRNSRP